MHDEARSRNGCLRPSLPITLVYSIDTCAIPARLANIVKRVATVFGDLGHACLHAAYSDSVAELNRGLCLTWRRQMKPSISQEPNQRSTQQRQQKALCSACTCSPHEPNTVMTAIASKLLTFTFTFTFTVLLHSQRMSFCRYLRQTYRWALRRSTVRATKHRCFSAHLRPLCVTRELVESLAQI